MNRRTFSRSVNGSKARSAFPRLAENAPGRRTDAAPAGTIEAEIKGLEEDFEAARRGIKDGKDKKRQKRFTGI